jgi:hypothetical protein
VIKEKNKMPKGTIHTNVDDTQFKKAIKFCSSHPQCLSTCPLYSECRGAYDMLYRMFSYAEELTAKIERLKKKH